jgi:hypothetical protein
MALRFCLLALSLIFAGSSGVLAASDQTQCRTMRIGDPGWTANIAQNGLPMVAMLSQVAMEQTYPPGPPPGPPIGQGGPMPRTMDQTYPPGGPIGPSGPMAQRSCMRKVGDLSLGVLTGSAKVEREHVRHAG